MEAVQRNEEVEGKMDEMLALSVSLEWRQAHSSQITKQQPDTLGLISYTILLTQAFCFQFVDYLFC